MLREILCARQLIAREREGKQTSVTNLNCCTAINEDLVVSQEQISPVPAAFTTKEIIADIFINNSNNQQSAVSVLHFLCT